MAKTSMERVRIKISKQNMKPASAGFLLPILNIL